MLEQTIKDRKSSYPHLKIANSLIGSIQIDEVYRLHYLY